MVNSPLTVHVYRGETVESSHAVHCMVMDKDGDILESWGDRERLVSPRSSLKPLQTIPLVESGALDAFNLGAEEIALACASHNAEPVHIEKVAAWLERIGLSVDDLECGGHLSLNKERAHEMIRNGEEMTGLLSDCSGKHTGMLTTARHQGHAIENYVAFDHPVQKQIFETISEMADYDVSGGACGTDGCSAPNPAIPLRNLTRAFTRLANPEALSDARAAACRRIVKAMAEHPYLLAGKDRFNTILIEESQGNIICKLGAEGNYMALVRDKGLVIYLKTEDGALERASHPVLGAVLNKFNAIDAQTDEAVSRFTQPVLKNWKGLEIGKITVPSL